MGVFLSLTISFVLESKGENRSTPTLVTETATGDVFPSRVFHAQVSGD
jgi:hypothetical protein